MFESQNIATLNFVSKRFSMTTRHILRTFISSNTAKFIAGGIAVGVPLHAYHRIVTHQAPPITHSPSRTPADNDILETSFQTRLLYKLYRLDFSEIRRTDVRIELFLLLCPTIFAGILSHRVYLRHSWRWRNKHFFDSVNVSLNTVTANESRFDLRVRTILETNLSSIIPNERGLNVFIDAAKKTNSAQPFIVIEDDQTRRSIYNLFKDHISTLSNQTFIAQDILSDSQYGIVEKYIMFMTVWPQTDGFNKKIRVQLVKKESLRAMAKALGTKDERVWMNGSNKAFSEERWALLQIVADELESEQRNNLLQSKNKYISQCELGIANSASFEIVESVERETLLK